VFTDATVASPGYLGVAYSDGVSASNTTSYALTPGIGSLPAGLSLNTSTGAITGTPTALGSFSFGITASGPGGSASTPTLTILILPPGRRFDGTNFVGLTTLKRFDGSAWVDVTVYRRFDGTNWVNISNV
jgi:hypothetical protein